MPPSGALPPPAVHKKDDDLRPSSRYLPSAPRLATRGAIPPRTSSWTPISPRALPRFRKRRVAGALLALALVYLFVHNIPTNLPPVPQRMDIRDPGRTVAGIPIPQFTSPYRQKKRPSDKTVVGSSRNERPPPRARAGEREADQHYYEGEINFVNFATGLQIIARKLGYASMNQNVVFVTANVASAARLIPLACEMHRWERNLVHFVYMGRDDVAIDELREINGVADGCDIFWHGEIAWSEKPRAGADGMQTPGRTLRLGARTCAWKSAWRGRCSICSRSSTRRCISVMT